MLLAIGWGQSARARGIKAIDGEPALPSVVALTRYQAVARSLKPKGTAPPFKSHLLLFETDPDLTSARVVRTRSDAIRLFSAW